jgi:hypothetical protein
MAGNLVTALAELRGPTVQEFVVIAAVGNMTIQAILIHRGMGPHKGASFLGMALITKFIDRIPLELGGAETSMVFMAVRALDFSFPDRMMGGPTLLSPYTLMTEIAEVWLRGL